jgi:hypothetical protein
VVNSTLSSVELRLIRLLQSLHFAQAREVLSRLSTSRLEKVPDLTHWIGVVANTAKPLLLLQWRVGMLRTAQRLVASSSERNRVGSSRSVNGMTRRVVPIEDIFASRKGVMWNERVSMLHAGRQSQLSSTCSVQVDKAAKRSNPIPLAAFVGTALRSSFDIYNARVLDAVDEAAFKFSRDTLDTATKDLKSAIKDLKKVLKTGLSKGQAVGYIAKRVEKIFADPMRSYRIATTEISRAQHAGQLMVAKESGLVTHKTWLASSDACDECLSLDGRSVEIDKPFYVDPKGGTYAVVQHPPFHVNCKCTLTEEVG